MLKRRFTIISFLLLFSFFFIGCDLLDDDPSDDPATGVTIPSGTWIESGTSPTIIVDIDLTNNLFTIYEYDSEDSLIDTIPRIFNLNSTETGYILEEYGDLAKENVTFTISGESITLVIGSESITFIKYTGVIPHPTWVVAVIDVDTGKVENGIPSGSWQTTDTPMDEIVMLGTDTITIYEYDAVDSTLVIQKMAYSIDTANKAFIAIDAFYDDTMTIPFNYVNDTLTVIAPSEDGPAAGYDTLTFVVYNAEGLPATWVVKDKQDHNEVDLNLMNGIYTDGIPSGAWQVNETPLEEIVMFTADTFYMYDYDATDSILYYSMMLYQINATKDTFYIDFGDPSNPMKFGVAYSYDAAAGILTVIAPSDDGTLDTVKLSPYTSDKLPENWVILDVMEDVDGPNDGPYLSGQYLSLDGNTVLQLYSESMEYFNYNPADSTIKTISKGYHINMDGDTIHFNDGGYALYLYKEDTLFITDDLGKTQTFTFYDGPIPVEGWILKDGGYEGDLELQGTWLIADGTMDEVLEIYSYELAILEYNSVDSIVYKQHMSYDLNETNDTIFVKSPDGTMAPVPYVIMNDTLKITEPENGEIVLYTRYDGPIPLDEWVVKDSTIHHGEPFMGQWIEEGIDPKEILMISDYRFEYARYIELTQNIVWESFDYYVDETTKEIIRKSMDGVESKVTIEVSADMDKITVTAGTITKTYVRYDGGIPHESWVVDNSYKLGGQWVIDMPEPNVVIHINNDTLWHHTYHPEELNFHTKQYMIEVSDNLDTLYLNMSGNITPVMIHFTNDMFEIKEGDMMGIYYRSDKHFPHDFWDVQDFQDHMTPPEFGEWITSDGNHITTVGPNVITHFAYLNGDVEVTRLHYMMEMDMTPGDTIYTEDELGTKGWVLLKGENDMLMIEDVSGLNTTMTRHDGAIPSSDWVVTGGDDLSFTAHKYIGAWSTTETPMDEIVKVGPTLITVYEYRTDSMETSTGEITTVAKIDTMYMDYKLNATEDGILMHDFETGEEMVIPVSLSGTVLTVTPDPVEGPQTFNAYDGPIPHTDWVVTE